MDGVVTRPKICLNMIVKNESHVIHEALQSIAPYIDYWVIVDTGSDDGTQEIIRSMMAELGLSGELHERPWRNFGHNRTEAIQLAQGQADYIWVMDADDILVGTPDFAGLTADVYFVEMRRPGLTYWQQHLFRDGLPWRYVGATHEYVTCDDPHTKARLGGDCGILYRQLGSNSLGAGKFERDLELLLSDVQRDPEDARSTFYLARTYEWLGDYRNALIWFQRRIAMGGWAEEVYSAMYKEAEMMHCLDHPWAEVADAYLRAWTYRPTRPEALNAIAFHYRSAEQYELGYLYATRAAQIPFPENDIYFFVNAKRWRALDEQSICAWWIGRRAEALAILRQALVDDDIPDTDRERILGNRAFVASQLLEESALYPENLVLRPAARRDAEVTVSLTAGDDPAATERTLNSFLRCCTDSHRVRRVLIIDTGLAADARETLAENYPFLDFIAVPYADLNVVRKDIGGHYWLHLWHGWRFFTEETLITRLVDVLELEPEAYQVGINLGDAMQLGTDSPARRAVRTTPRGNRYLLSATPPRGPAMFDINRLNRVLADAPADGSLDGITATLDEVLCIHDS